MTTLRLLSYNVRSMRDDVDALGRVMREIAPDVAIIQEAPRFLRWRSACAALARRAGLVLVTGGRASGANLVLSSLAVDVLATHELAFTADRRLHHRGAAVAVLQPGRRAVRGGRHPPGPDRGAPAAAPGRAGRLRRRIRARRRAADRRRRHQRGARLGDLAAAAAVRHRRLRRGRQPATASPTPAPRRSAGSTGCSPTRGCGCSSAETIDSADVRIASDHRPLVVEYLLADAERVQLPGQDE